MESFFHLPRFFLVARVSLLLLFAHSLWLFSQRHHHHHLFNHEDLLETLVSYIL